MSWSFERYTLLLSQIRLAVDYLLFDYNFLGNCSNILDNLAS